jgi:predicted nucleic acid-binding Zn ribbon protein
MRHRWGDLANQRFGRLTVLRYVPTSESGRSRGLWDCRCACGTRLLVSTGNLVHRPKIACGCRRKQARPARTHEGHCQRCGDLFLGVAQQRFCSAACRIAHDNNRRRPRVHKVCPICETHFIGRKRRVYCSARCADVADARRQTARHHGTPAQHALGVRIVLGKKGKQLNEQDINVSRRSGRKSK